MSEELDLSTEEEVVTETQEETHAPTMDETIANTLKEIEARGSEEETPEQESERLRDEKGRFAKKDAEPEQKPDEPEQQPAVEAQPDPVSAPTVPPELQRLGLKKEEAEAFAAAPEVLKQAFLRRSDEMHKGIEQFRNKAMIGDAMERAIAPFMQDIQAVGATPDVAIRSLLASERALRHGTPEQKVQMLTKIARDYGIDMGQAQEYQANQPMADPQVSQLQSELQQMKSWIQQQNQSREWQERQTLNSEIAQFAQDPANTHFEAVRNDMAGLLQAGIASSLKDAYEKAIYANPTIRAQVLAEQQAKAEKARQAEAAQKAQAAKRAAAVNMPRKGVLSAARPVGSMEDTIRQTAERLGIM